MLSFFRDCRSLNSYTELTLIIFEREKMINLFSRLIVLCAVLIIGATGCGNDEDNEWKGTWTMEKIDDVNFEVADAFAEILDISVERSITFDNDGTWEADITTEGWGESITDNATGDYSLDSSNYVMSGSGDIFLAAKDDVSLLKTGSFEDTGTWIREGDTLTLTRNDGTVVVLKRQ